MYYAITVKDATITGVHESLTPITVDTFTLNPELAGDTVVTIPSSCDFQTGENIFCYDETGTRKPDVWCIENGYMELPYGYEILEGELLRTQTPVENTPITIQEYLNRLAEEVKVQVKQDAILEVQNETQKIIGSVQEEIYNTNETAKELLRKESTEQVAHLSNSMKPLINELLIDKPAAVVLALISMIDDWKEGKWAAGKSLTHSGYPYKVVQTHDSTGNPTWTPDVKPALFAPWHGVSMETALPWKAPTGAQDMYKVDEYMVWTDSKIYQCKSDTAYSPTEYAQAWQLIS